MKTTSPATAIQIMPVTRAMTPVAALTMKANSMNMHGWVFI